MQHQRYRPQTSVKPCALMLAILSCLAIQARAHAAERGRDTAVSNDATPAPAAGKTAAPASDDAADPQAQASGQAVPEKKARAGAAGKAEADKVVQLGAVTVTAQKREERPQDVPIALSVFDAQSLDDHKIEGGAELLRATPNVTFSKSNFASYNFSIRGVGTKALSVTTDPGVAVSFNSTPLIRNRLFEQEYFDVNRIEVLRGPQGTLYGRNATGGVVNMLPNLPSLDGFDSWFKAETGNFDSRRFSGMVNVPIGSTLAYRLAGAWTKRSGYDNNTVTNKDVNGRDLWGGRMGLLWKPSDKFSANLIWEHFNENDDRSRTGKQLCHNDPGPTEIGDTAVPEFNQPQFSQGCQPGSLYGKGAFGVPNGASLSQLLFARTSLPLGITPDFLEMPSLVKPGDPFAGVQQSTNLRTIATTYDPRFKAKNDVVQINLEFKPSEDLKLVSQTAYSRDFYYSTQDYGRFQSNPIFNDSNGLINPFPDPVTGAFGLPAYPITPGGVYTDPQLGPSTGYLAVDLVRSHSKQWSQEFRLQSAFDGRFNFSVGANYLDYKINEDYFVFNNVFTATAQEFFNQGYFGRTPINCTPNYVDEFNNSCVYIDPNPIGKINGQGHNYFRSQNIGETRSKALFGEIYYQLSDTVKLTAGLRYTDDQKISTPVPSQLLLMPGFAGGGYVNYGYPHLPNIDQRWRKPTGRLVLDWKPKLSFTDETLVYGSLSRGYKAGGTNSPGIGADPKNLYFNPGPSTFKPEYVNAFEVGTKNMMAGGKFMLNASAFYYDYKDYQVSQIVDRATLNENFDAKMFGFELETAWQATRALRFDGNIGYLHTRIADGARSIDVLNRTQGDPDYVVIKPWLQQASNCVAPKASVEKLLQWAQTSGYILAFNDLASFCGGPFPTSNFVAPDGSIQLASGDFYNPNTQAPNGGRGFYADLGGKQLPNSPHWTGNVGTQYTFFTASGDFTLRGDYYRQSSSYARIYNTVSDKLRGWGNANLSLTWQAAKSDLTVQLYVKNLFNDTPITDAFVNSDDSGLTTNVFMLDPRIYGISVRMGFN